MKRNEELIVPLATLREMFAENKNEVKAIRLRSGVPHPLNRFAINGEVKSCQQADMLMDCLNATALEKPGSIGWRGARWFLLESTMFLEVCAAAEIDGRSGAGTWAACSRRQTIKSGSTLRAHPSGSARSHPQHLPAPQNLLTFQPECEKY